MPTLATVPPAVILVMIIIVMILLAAVGQMLGMASTALVNRRQPGQGGAERPDPVPPSYTAPPPPSTQPAPAYAPLVTAQSGAMLADMPAPIRQHTLIAARPGDGKTTALNTLLVADISAGAQAIVCNPQFAYYHPTDQPIDLRPIRDQFEAVFDYAGIERTLTAVYTLVEGRNALYREGQDVGHPISIMIDEWPSIVSSDYGPSCAALVQKLVREARKCNIWVTLAAQDGQVDTLGFKSGLRASFLTRLCGNVDPFTWRALCGSAVQRPVQRGQWATETGIVSVERPTTAMIAGLAGQKKNEYAAIAHTDIPDMDAVYTGTYQRPGSYHTDPYQEAERLAEDTSLSANEIFRRVGGDRNAVLARVGRIRGYRAQEA